MPTADHHTRRYVGIHLGILRSEAVLATSDGSVLARVEGQGASPRRVGLASALAEITCLFRRAFTAADLPADTSIDRLAAIVADVDLPAERASVRAALEGMFKTTDIIVANDVHGLLWAGMRRPAGVALICDSGINAIARASTGRRAEYLSLGRISGDWGGALELGREVLYAAQRSADGRGPKTRLQYEVEAHFQARDTWDAIVAFHQSDARESHLEALARRLFDADAAGDEVAQTLVTRLSEEVVGMVAAAADRARLPATGADIVLSGWVLTAGFSRLDAAIDAAMGARLPGATVARYSHPLVVGAALACFGAERGGPLAAEGDAIADGIERTPVIDPERRPSTMEPPR